MPSLIDPNTPNIIGNGGGSNIGGTNVAVPGASMGTTPTLGGQQNPLMPAFPSGQNMPSMSSLLSGINIPSFPANGPGGNPMMSTTGPTSTGGQDFASSLGFNGSGGNSWMPSENDFIKAMHKSGFSAGLAGMLYNFLASGAGFNKQIGDQLVASMQPGIQRGEADIMEWLGSAGISNSSSPAAISLGDYLSQVQLNEGQIFAGLMEQATQNYLTVLMGGKGNPPPNMLQNFEGLMQATGQASGGAGELLKGIAAL